MKLLWPVDGAFPISAGFDQHEARTPPSSAPGLDIACPAGTPVLAAADGRVWIAGETARSGLYVRLFHRLPGQRGARASTLYCHLSEVFVQGYQDVKAGQVIGMSGASGMVTGPHLHFAWSIDRAWCDPMEFMQKGE